ncbi:unnamed protein product [Rotaria sordida]|uniref:Uncharacterized protein n=1 Tax=Rotaria sordida TaxID=392033 RepID=A0A820JB55_9BILA|nr:unnamed protein product [Rotaria sordida]CAF0935575.1 unnamed protein product [Rotaria sordida]CAF4031872.1 unnamed protein product [Rotaria sordida]CAF4321201.1 unnamed protein product [Rotaria sordida]
MNLFIGKKASNNELNSNKDDLFILETQKQSKTNENDDDTLILTEYNHDQQTKSQTLLTPIVQQLFGKPSSSSSSSPSSSSTSSCSSINSNKTNSKDEKLILDENNTDEQLIDLN